jgi:hypothetical protein
MKMEIRKLNYMLIISLVLCMNMAWIKTKRPSRQCKITKVEAKWSKDDIDIRYLPYMQNFKMSKWYFYPTVRVVISNTGDSDIDSLYLKIVFSRLGVVKGVTIETIGTILSKCERGSYIIGNFGYDYATGISQAFPLMRNNSKGNWRFEIFLGDRKKGPWRLVANGMVVRYVTEEGIDEVLRRKGIEEPKQPSGNYYEEYKRIYKLPWYTLRDSIRQVITDSLMLLNESDIEIL